LKRCTDRLAIVAGLALVLGGCAGVPQAPAPSAPEKEPAAQPSSLSAPSAAAQKHFDAALDLMRRGRDEDAATAFFAMTRAYPDYTAPLLNLAIIRARAGRVGEAESALRQALERDPKNVQAANMLGVLYREAGRFEEAKKAYEQALAIDPAHPDTHYNLGILYDLYLQEPRKALAHYELSRHYGDDDAVIERWLADLRQRLGGGNAPSAGEGEAR
jgi:Flp pilus assembly protein TadD